MKTHILNQYKLNNAQDIDFSYKLIEFDIDYLKDSPKEFKKCLEKIEWQVASNTMGPASVVNIDRKKYIAIPSNKNLSLSKAQAGSVSVPLKELPTVYNIRTNNSEHKDLIYKLLDFEIRNHLQNKHQLWSLNTYQFYLKKAVFTNEDIDVDIFGGFVYRLLEDNGQYFVCVNPTYKYVSKYFLSDVIDNSKDKEFIDRFKREKCIYMNGDNWYQVEVTGFANPIKTQEFIDRDGTSKIVKEYIINRTKNHSFNVSKLLKDEHLTLLYKYPYKDVKSFYGATSIAKLLYSTDNLKVKSLHSRAILPPFKRFEYINDNISRFFQDVEWNGTSLSISLRPLESKLKVFNIPSLLYRNGKVLSVKHEDNQSPTVSLRDFGAERKNWIKENQVLKQTQFVPQYLVVPESMDINLAKTFKANAEKYLTHLSSNFPGFKLITYKAKTEESATMQVNRIAQEFISKNISSGSVLFVLPFNNKTSNKKVKNFHDCLKKKFFPKIQFQCASLSRINSFYSSFPGGDRLFQYKPKPETIDKYKSYLFNLIMEFLIVNRKWPYSLNKNLNYDIYIGIDVHERFAGFCFFYKNGENIVFDYKEVPLISGDVRRRAEKLKVESIAPKLLEKLTEHIPKFAPNPNGIVIVRDGKSFGQEEVALKKVIHELHIKGLVDENTIKWGVLDFHKKTANPLRIAVKTDGFDRIDNTMSGTYKIIDQKNGFIFNTGYPFRIKGTANPIHLSLKEGNINFEKAMEDMFAQTILAFSAPDRPNSLPICLKLIDSFLEPIAANFQDIDFDAIEEVEVLSDELIN